MKVQIKYIKTCVKRPLSNRQKIGFQDRSSLIIQVRSIAECSKGSILPYFRHSLSICHFDICFCLFLNGRLHRFYCINLQFHTTQSSYWMECLLKRNRNITQLRSTFTYIIQHNKCNAQCFQCAHLTPAWK